MFLGFGVGVVGVKNRARSEVRRATDCVEGGSFRASRLGVWRCSVGLGQHVAFVLRCVARLNASREASLGRRASECELLFFGIGGCGWVLEFAC